MSEYSIPKATIHRLTRYYRCLERFLLNGKSNVSSKEMANKLNIKPSQIRKDLSYFGEFGKRGVGYDVKELMISIENILGMKKNWSFCIVGIGNLGLAIANYPGLVKAKFDLKAIFDNDKNKIGVSLNDMVIHSVEKLEEVIKEKNISIGVLTVPGKYAQALSNRMVEAGIEGIINFTPVRVIVPKNVMLEEIDISISFRTLAFQINLNL